MANEYATPAELKATLELSDYSFADADIELALTAASRAVEHIANRRFYQDPDAQQKRYYTPDDPCVLRIDDVIELTSVRTDDDGDGVFETTWQPTDYVIEPLNAPTDGKPWTTLRVHPHSPLVFPCVPRSVEVTGRFGWPAVPEPIKEATIILATRLLRRAREAPFGVVGLPALEGGFDGAARVAAADPDVIGLVRPYARNRIVVA